MVVKVWYGCLRVLPVVSQEEKAATFTAICSHISFAEVEPKSVQKWCHSLQEQQQQEDMKKNLVSHFSCLCLDIQNTKSSTIWQPRQQIWTVLDSQMDSKPCSNICALRNTCNKKEQKRGDPQQQQPDVGWHAFKHISSEENGQQQLWWPRGCYP
jgi:hypothetical protein